MYVYSILPIIDVSTLLFYLKQNVLLHIFYTEALLFLTFQVHQNHLRH